MNTQNEALLAELKSRGSVGITPLEALNRIGILRLAARVHDLRKQGYKISSRPYKISGDRRKVALYTLEEG